MLAALVIVLREVLEAGLVVGIVLAATRGVAGRGRMVSLGVGTGILGACVVAAFASSLGSALEGTGQEVFNGVVLSLAVVMLGWHNIWMAQHGRELSVELRSVGKAVAVGARPLTALAIVVGAAVLREGSEAVLFLYGIAVQGGAGGMLVGGVLGLAAGVAVAAALYAGLVVIPLRHLFSVTGALITLLAAGMAAQVAQLLQQSGWVEAGSATVWDTSWLLAQDSLPGHAMHALVGYTDRPSQLQLVVYVATFAVIWSLTRYARARTEQARLVARGAQQGA